MRRVGGFIGPLVLVLSVLLHGVAARNWKRNAIPKYEFDSNTASCAWWLDNDKEGSWTCQGIQDVFAVSMTDFLRWNPSVPSSCDALKVEWSYCLATNEGWRTPAAGSQGTVTVTVPATDAASATVSVTNTVTTTSSVTVGRTVLVSLPVTVQVTVLSSVRITTTATATMTATATVRTTVPTTVPTTVRVTTTVENVVRTTVTTTVTAQGGPTPVPYQPGMVGNCKAFYFVRWGDTCDDIASKFGITTSQLVAWNPQARSDCTKLLAETFCCVRAF
ncbi:hypothetical protein C8A05DRAFT_36714 [Staphylotrichum tortipilum]|uniref:LysM domain-containing protein n=1 Tax=Staphylotrichum tortipilum TaxID=2831512 RepID=A0AAN6MF59_9PEZI|nr:hypothetical protein C8A05DRAFT_36714 [Staphylotrichum longicolle]